MASNNYFQKRTDERLASIETKIDQLLEFKFKLLGSSAAISAVVSLVVGLAAVYFGSH